MSASCSALADLDRTNWAFCPSTPPAIVFTVLFALTTFAHLSQAIFYKKAYCWVIVGSAFIQTVNYICRIISITNPNTLGPYAAWFILMLIAPLFTNAFVYMVMGRMIWNYIPSAKLYRITAWRFSAFFVIFDIIALIIQVAGASSSAGNRRPNQQVINAIHIYMGGVGFQQFFILLFLVFAIKFHQTVLQQVRQGAKGASGALPLLYAIYLVLALITMRIVFRLCEYAQGFHSNIPTHEAYQYCLDSVPMLFSLVILNVIHPGRIMQGEESNIPSRKERKAQGIYSKSENISGSPVLTV
ncbi:hypothetical protein VE01_09358 [Pseudogymnoascus verrucosus]|uniref:RTA1 domain protein n=1 Tax=Pseudogymnoascus verrucosus TaxID=342668 RepID=A0A1B8G7I7_9PEZI|nr:uncharacterized protein VE01_09358 [Pseudogymnoascus verrucosus]OBT91793.2 hypothetical protein VE01_09358 [Pseudogymnoascus verrucosus]